ncbi:Bestrophin-3 [Chionoecetes opilio]|uniref:Bestrophin-3 n=1 Tax=Chionoecetes opilio TaxID=41210 RepID=A0A8J5C7Q6_CHIOP|nr:Bestrophin-3 [Chionoecetes opilio]
MTVTYTSDVATCRGFGCFWKLLFRWKGSVYKLVWPELLAYSCIYYVCNMVYRFALNEEQKRFFEKISIYCQYFSDLIPLSFVLGFYVSIVVQRWWDQYLSLPWPDSLALFVSTSIHGLDERSRLMRRTVMRYVNLTEVITFIMISPGVKKRFPTLDHLVEAGIMTSNEQKIFDDLNAKTSHPKYWMPLVWAGSIIARARKEGRIRDDFAVKTMLDEINRFRGLCGGLLSYDWISIPLVYTQVVTLAVYSFFIATIMGRQFLDPAQKISTHEVDFYIPVFTLLQFFFYMGWLKVAESLVNPFGEDDDDFEINWLVDRNLQVSYLIVDEMHSEHPELIQDMYWDEVFPQELPYTIAAEQFRRDPPQGSTANIEVSEQDQEFLPMMVEVEEDEGIQDSMSGINEGTGEADDGVLPGGVDASRRQQGGQVDMEKGTRAIDISKKTRSARSSISGMASSQPLSSRKPSMLSMLFNRLTSNSQENVRRHGIKPNVSNTSVRHGRPPRSFKRSASRVSSTSQDSAIFRMSGLSLSANAVEEVSSPRVKTRNNSCDDDGPIVIKIKRRDKDGHVIGSQLSDDLDSTSDSGKAPLLGKVKKTASTRLFSDETAEDEPLITSGKRKRVPDTLTATKSLGSSVSIRTNIFHGDETEEDNCEEDKKELLTQNQGGGKAGMNLKGLSKTISTSRSQQEQLRLSSENIEKRVSASEELLAEDDCFLPGDLQKPYESSSSEPVSPSFRSPIPQSMASRSLTDFDSSNEQSSKPGLHPNVSPIGTGQPSLYKPFSGDLNVCLEDTSPKASTPEGKFTYVKPECASVFQSSGDQPTATKDILETIIGGPLQSIPEVENV